MHIIKHITLQQSARSKNCSALATKKRYPTAAAPNSSVRKKSAAQRRNARAVSGQKEKP